MLAGADLAYHVDCICMLFFACNGNQARQFCLPSFRGLYFLLNATGESTILDILSLFHQLMILC